MHFFMYFIALSISTYPEIQCSNLYTTIECFVISIEGLCPNSSFVKSIVSNIWINAFARTKAWLWWHWLTSDLFLCCCLCSNGLPKFNKNTQHQKLEEKKLFSNDFARNKFNWFSIYFAYETHETNWINFNTHW